MNTTMSGQNKPGVRFGPTQVKTTKIMNNALTSGAMNRLAKKDEKFISR